MKTFEEFDFFPKKTDEEKAEKYFDILSRERQKYYNLMSDIKNNTLKHREYAFDDYLMQMENFIYYLNRLYALSDNYGEIHNRTIVYFDIIERAIEKIKMMKSISSLDIESVRKIFKFYNKYAQKYNRSEKILNFR
jgi:hypothetical protein